MEGKAASSDVRIQHKDAAVKPSMAKVMEIKLAIFYITGVEPDKGDPDRVNDAVYGPDFYLSMSKAVSLARSGVEFRTSVSGAKTARALPYRSPRGNWYLKTSPDAYVANNLGIIAAERQISTLLTGGLPKRHRNAFRV